jgi:hypothetical protein
VPTAVLALLLFAATVDPRLDEPLRLLAALHDRDGQPIGELYARRPDMLKLTLVVADLPIAAANFEHRRRTVTVTAKMLEEDPRVVAAALAHELQHAADFDLVALGTLPKDCVDLEARAFEATAIVTRGFWPDELPDGTDWERGIAIATQAYESGGMDGLRTMVREMVGYERQCVALSR